MEAAYTTTSLSALPPNTVLDGSADRIDALADAIGALAGHIQAATCRLLELVAEMDRLEGWAQQGARSCAHWLSWKTSLSLPTAREYVRVAQKKDDMPRIWRAFSAGKLSYSKVRAASRVVTPDNEEQLLEQALEAPTPVLERIVRKVRGLDRPGPEQDREQTERRYFSYHRDDDGMVVVRGRLPADVGELLIRALQRARDTGAAQGEDAADGQPSATGGDHEPERPGAGVSRADHEQGWSQELADALGLVAGAALEQGLDAATGRGGTPGAALLLHVDAEVLADAQAPGRCEIGADGLGVSTATAQRLSCDGPVLQVADRGGPDEAPCSGDDGDERQGGCPGTLGRCTLQLKRLSRRPGTALLRAVRQRDRGSCQFPGRHARRHLCTHHVTHWAEGGHTDLGNLVTLCSAHHRLVHEGGFDVTMDDNSTFQFLTPDGQPIKPCPTAPALPPNPDEALAAHHRDLGLVIYPWTVTPAWDGVPVNDDWAVEALLPPTVDGAPPGSEPARGQWGR